MKVAIIGAGSGFGGRISMDILARFRQEDVEFALCDLDLKKAGIVREYVEKVIIANSLPGKRVYITADRKEAVKDADFVLLSVSIGGPAYYDEPFESEMSIPARYGIVQTVADTLGPGAIFRALRSAPEMQNMIKDIQELSDACILNLTNPMAMLTWVLETVSPLPVVGLCHGVAGNKAVLASLAGVDEKDVHCKAFGINHMTWFTEFAANGVDLLPMLKEKICGDKRNDFFFRADAMEHFGYFTTEGERHFPEYVPWFRRYEPSVFEPYAAFTRSTKEKRQIWYADMGVAIENADTEELILSHESASGIMQGMVLKQPFEFSGNVRNNGYITNLPPGAIVEVPCIADENGITPQQCGSLPLGCAALCKLNIIEQELVANAILLHDLSLAKQALMLDPMVMATCTLKQASQMFDEMLKRERELGLL